MGKKEKLVQRIKTLPNDFSFDELCTLLSSLGFEQMNMGKTSGARLRFVREDCVIVMHKPHPGNELKQYQIRQVISVLESEGLI